MATAAARTTNGRPANRCDHDALAVSIGTLRSAELDFEGAGFGVLIEGVGTADSELGVTAGGAGAPDAAS